MNKTGLPLYAIIRDGMLWLKYAHISYSASTNDVGTCPDYR